MFNKSNTKHAYVLVILYKWANYFRGFSQNPLLRLFLLLEWEHNHVKYMTDIFLLS